MSATAAPIAYFVMRRLRGWSVLGGHDRARGRTLALGLRRRREGGKAETRCLDLFSSYHHDRAMQAGDRRKTPAGLTSFPGGREGKRGERPGVSRPVEARLTGRITPNAREMRVRGPASGYGPAHDSGRSLHRG